jgi:hypothetical protein
VLSVERFRPGAVVILYLKDPKERFWGVLRSLDATGVSVLGVDLQAFDDWVRQVADRASPDITPSMVFFPLLRLEKILLDTPSGEIPSLAGSFESRTGRELLQYLGITEAS